jgi:hypothetical protein
MITHEFPYPKLVVCKKLAIVEKLVVVVTSHIQKLGKKRFEPFGRAIISFLVLQILIRSLMKHNINFLKTWSYIFARGSPFPLVTIFG